MVLKSVVILANSVKRKPGRCIAGREIVRSGDNVSLGPWIRPVSPDGEASEGELLPKHCLTKDNVNIDVLSIFEIPLARHRADPGQPENWEVVTGKPWKRIGSLKRPSLSKLIEHPPHLWDFGRPGSRSVGVDAPLNVRGNSSLALILPSDFRAWTMREMHQQRGYERTTIRGTFKYAGRVYELDITDDDFAPEFRARATRTRSEYRPAFGDNCALCVSLGAPFKGYHYKLIAAVIPFEEPAPQVDEEIPF
jgi:hypothetical protein